MIPFASQRGLGQDLATHLSNAHENELTELADLRGAIAPDLHGAFAEWEAQAHGLTKCKNYLYSLSINPDPNQEPLTREQYFDYIARTEKHLGLEDQPRAVVFHVKDGRHHAHVVWSRIDADNEKAVHMAFDKDKLMMVTREFAREHGLELPAGYFKEKGAQKTHQISLYEQEQQRATGISIEQRKDEVTAAWRESDGAKAFVQALAERGYILATGKRPYVLVDLYGNMNALPKLIDDKSVRTRDVRALLETDYPPESLPSVEEAKSLVAEHRQSFETHLENEQREAALAELKSNWSLRRDDLQEQKTFLGQKQHQAREELAIAQRDERRALSRAYAALGRAIQSQREGAAPSGLAAFLGRVSGIEKIRKKIYAYRDRKRQKAHVKKLLILRAEQEKQRVSMARAQEMHRLDLARRIRSLESIEKRERASLIKELKAKARLDARGGSSHMPGLPFIVKGRRTDLSDQEKHRLGHETEQAFDEASAGIKEQQQIDLSDAFTRAVEGEKEDDDRGSSEGPKPKIKSRPQRRRRKPRKRADRDNDNDLDRGL